MRTEHTLCVAFVILVVCATIACSGSPVRPEQEKPAGGDAVATPVIAATLVASDKSWGNTEGPAVDSNGTIYRIAPDGRTSVFSEAVTGPNGIALSADEKTLYVSHNVSKSTSKTHKWPLNPDGSAGVMSELATVNDCVADGMALDREG